MMKNILWMKSNILLIVKCCSFGICLKIFEDESFIRRRECNDSNY
jgi:hypothetical protein